MTTARLGEAGRVGTATGADGTSTVPTPADASQHPRRVDLIVDTAVARRIRWHHVLVRRRRWSRELDRLCARDPWRHATVLHRPADLHRISALTENAVRLAVGGSVDPAWVRAQLLDLRDLLEVGGRRG